MYIHRYVLLSSLIKYVNKFVSMDSSFLYFFENSLSNVDET